MHQSVRETGAGVDSAGARWLPRAVAACGGGAAGAASLVWALVARDGWGVESTASNPTLEHIGLRALALAVVLGGVAVVLLGGVSLDHERFAPLRRAARAAGLVGAAAMVVSAWQLARMPEVYFSERAWVSVAVIAGVLLLLTAALGLPVEVPGGRTSLLVAVRAVLVMLIGALVTLVVPLAEGGSLVATYVEDESAMEWLLVPALAVGALLGLLAAARGRRWELVATAAVLLTPVTGYAWIVWR